MTTTETTTTETSSPSSLRLPPGMLHDVDALVERLRGTAVAAASGNRWGRASAMRLALARGLAVLAREHAEGGAA